MKRAKNFWLLIQAVACFVWVVVKEFAKLASDKIRAVPDDGERMPNSSPGFFRGVYCAVRSVFDFLTSEKSTGFIKDLQEEFGKSIRHSQRGDVKLFTITGRRIPGDYSRWQMLKSQISVVAFLTFSAGIVAGSVLAFFFGYSPILIGLILPAALLFVACIAVSISGYRIRCFHLGLVGERKMAQHLERMISLSDYFVFHGVKAKYGDIDHVLVCPKGVFCFEVKVRPSKKEGEKILYRIKAGNKRGEIKYKDGGKFYGDALEQAMENAKWLHNRLQEKIGESPKFVRRIVYFPKREVEREGEHPKRNEFVSGDPAEIVQFIKSIRDERDNMLSESENEEKIRGRIKKIREFLDRESAEEWEEIPL